MSEIREPLERECLDVGQGECSGPIEYRMALSSTGKSFPRCERHWELRLIEQERINQTYPVNAPSDFDPLDAGESWDEEPGVNWAEDRDPDWMNP